MTLHLHWYSYISIYIKIYSYISIYIKIYSYICRTIIISVLISSSHFLRPAGLGSSAIMSLASRGSTALDTPAAENKHITICPSHIHRARHSTVRMLKPTVWLVGGFVVGASCVLCHFGSRMAPTFVVVPPSFPDLHHIYSYISFQLNFFNFIYIWFICTSTFTSTSTITFYIYSFIFSYIYFGIYMFSYI